MAQSDEAASNRHSPHIKGQGRPEFTYEEVQVLQECRRNSILYRGIPLAIIGYSCARAAIQYGYFRKRPSLASFGTTTFGFLTGIASYSETCTKKILALENSRMADQVRKMRGLPLQLHTELQDEETTGPVVDDDIFKSPLNKRIQDGQAWDEVRFRNRTTRGDYKSFTPEKEGTEDEATVPVVDDDTFKSPLNKGIQDGKTWDDARLRNRATQGNYRSSTSEEEDHIKRRSRRLPSESSSGTRSPSLLDDKESESTESNAKGFPRKNKYGDDII